jgi:hypothetical protein
MSMIALGACCHSRAGPPPSTAGALTRQSSDPLVQRRTRALSIEEGGDDDDQNDGVLHGGALLARQRSAKQCPHPLEIRVDARVPWHLHISADSCLIHHSRAGDCDFFARYSYRCRL